MNLHVTADRTARFGRIAVPCAIGRAGFSADKREGDGATPLGDFVCRWLYWRADRMVEPVTRLGRRPLVPDDGWCDDVAAPDYNRPVRLPYPASCEALWREDGFYDVIVVLGHNDGKTVPGRGSAIFLHVARPNLAPTEGCVALPLADLLTYLREAGPGSRVKIGVES